MKRWLTCEVLPSIRTHGQYPPPPPIEIEALSEPEPINAPHWSSRAQRFLEDADRIATEEGMAVDKLLSAVMSKQAITRLREYGEGLRNFLKNELNREAVMGAGFDMQYVVNGRRTLTREERALIASLRRMEPHQRALVFHQLTLETERIRALPEPDEI